MENYNSLNKVIDIIEQKLDDEIEYKDLAKIIGTSEYTLQRIFCFLTGITLTDYIRKRKLSRAAEEIKMTNDKIIDIAIKYGYDSTATFSRAFYKMHGVMPSDVRKNECTLKMFPKVEFKPINNNIDELNYRILKLPEQIFYGKSTEIISIRDKQSIKKLWEECENDGTIQNITDDNNGLYYGVTEYIDLTNSEETMKYYVLGKKNKKGYKTLEIPEAKWVAFRVDSKEQKDILGLINIIYTKWLSTSSYKVILPYPSLEIYYKDYCEYCIAVEE